MIIGLIPYQPTLMMNHLSLPHLFESSVQQFAGNVLLMEKRNDRYTGMSYAEAYDQVRKTAWGLLDLGVEKGDRVALISEGRNDWVISELAILFCGGVCVPLSVKIEEPSDLQFRLSHAGCKGIIVSALHQHKVVGLAGQLPDLEFVVILGPLDEDLLPKELQAKLRMVDVETLRLQAETLQDKYSGVLEKRKESLEPGVHANICYTSGTTADPKGIILTHGNYLHNVEQASAIFDVPATYTSLHILPWDHSFAHTVGIYALIRNGASLASLKIGKTQNETIRNIPQCINEIKPHFLLSVPALAKNFRANIEKGVRDKGKLVWLLFTLALKTAYVYNREGHNRGGGLRNVLKPLYKLFDSILFKKIREGFGGRLQFFVGGGALLDLELQRFFYAIGMPMYQGYGLTEAAPVISSNTPAFHKMGSSGKVVPWLDLKICGEDNQEKPIGEVGEIVVRGQNVMAGYWANDTATSDTIRDGWLYTGDLGYLDQGGYLYVLGRTKSLLIGSDGEKYSPEGIEEAIVEHSGYFDQVLLYNNQQPYTVGLVLLNRTTMQKYLEAKGLDAQSERGQLAALDKIRDELNRFMPGGELGDRFPARWQPVAISILTETFSEANGLINSTMKIVRPAVHQKYQETLSRLYTPEGKDMYNEENKKALTQLLS